MKSDTLIIVGLITCLFAIVAFLLALAMLESQSWQEFAKANDCREFGRVSPTISTGFDTNGKMIIINSTGKTGYRCKDGSEIWR